MKTRFPIYLQLAVLVTTSLAGTLNSAWAERDADYLDALGDEAKQTKMKNENPAPETVPEPAVLPDESTDFKKITANVTLELQRLLGVEVKTGGNAEEDLEKVVSTAIERGSSVDDIRLAVGKAMAGVSGQYQQTVKKETLESVSKALNQIVGANREVATGNPKDNYIRSLNEQLTEESKSEIQSVETGVSLRANGTGAKGNTSANPNIEQLDSERTITVLKGESLSIIAQRIYGNPNYYDLLYEANQGVIADPDLIQIGQVIRVPNLPE